MILFSCLVLFSYTASNRQIEALASVIIFVFVIFSQRLCISQFQQCSSPPPGKPRGICSRCQSRGWGIRNFIVARGLDICIPRGDPRAFDTCVLESAMDEFIGIDEAFVKQWLVRQGLEKLVFKVMFSQF